MKYIILLFVTFCCLLSAAHGQERWDAYMAKFDSKPGSVLVDMGLYSTAPDKRYPFLVITGPKAHKCNSKGMPDQDEINLLEEVLDATTTFLTGVTVKVLTGTLTYNCERVNYYYLKDSTGVRNAIQRMYNRNYKDYDYVLTIKSDPEWKTYLTFLYPSDEMQNWMENEKIVSQLLQKGDSLKNKRDIVFEAYFRTDTGRRAFTDFAVKKGYKIENTALMDNTHVAKNVIFSRNSTVVLDSINKWTYQIKDEAARHGGLFNGWTAPVK